MNDRRRADEQLGYITAKLESHMNTEGERMAALEGKVASLDGKMDQILMKVNAFKLLGAFLKTVGSIVFLALALKFGDIKLAWDVFMKGF